MQSRRDAIEKLSWYAMRWKIETYHKILKSGCRAEASKLRMAQRIVNLIAIFCILGWRVHWLTMMNRVAPTAPDSAALTTLATRILDRLFKEKPRRPSAKAPLSSYVAKVGPIWWVSGAHKGFTRGHCRNMAWHVETYRYRIALPPRLVL